MARSVSFEVYYMQNGRWQIHARYESDQREEAIEEAKRLDTGAFSAACVVRESFDSATNTSSESVVYHTPTMKAKPPVDFITSGAQDTQSAAAAKSRKPAAPAGSAAANASADAKKRISNAKKERADRLTKDKKPAKPKAKTAHEPARAQADGDELDTAQLAVRIALAFLAACIVGTVIGVIAFYGLKGLAEVRVVFDRTINQLLLIGAWVVGWGFAFFPMLKRAINSARAKVPRPHAPAMPVPDPRRMRRETPAADHAERRDAAVPEEASEPSEQDKAAEAIEAAAREQEAELDALAASLAADLEDARHEKESEEAEPDPEAEGPTDAEASDLPDEAEGDQEPDAAATGEGEAGEAEAADVETEPAEEIPQTGPAAVGYGLSRLVREAQALFGKLLTQDSYLRFGLILFLAGAAETFARRAGVAQKQLVELLSIEIENLGASKQHAKGFAANIDEYLLDQRYFDMYAAGRAGALRISKGTNDDSGLERAVETWRLPPDADQSAQSHDDGAMPDSKHFDSTPRKGGGEEEPLGFVAVLFTDIVDSTNLQQKNGDKWMMNVVRAHNDIVREAIQRFGGREIKHTGDGIMASFPDVLGAAEASLAMQDGFGRFSEMMPDLAFQVRAGLSAGEPIHESGDIFGTPVNLAARVMSKAGAGEIAVSSIVREMCQGQAMKFQELGRFELKGFPEPQPIYRLTRPRKRLRDNKTARSTATVPAG